MTHYYYYDPDTGFFKMRFSKPYDRTDLPYIQKPAGWRYSDYKMNLSTLEPELK
jgi:hypothetical protein